MGGYFRCRLVQSTNHFWLFFRRAMAYIMVFVTNAAIVLPGFHYMPYEMSMLLIYLTFYHYNLVILCRNPIQHMT